MKTNMIRTVLAAAALAVAGSAAAQEAERPVAIRTDGLPSHVAERLRAKAQEGQTALIQYVHRTRMMGNQVRIDEIVVKPADAAGVAKAPAEPRLAKAEGKK